MNRWLVSGLWLFAVFALVSASMEGAGGVGAMWSMPVALVGTVALLGWPTQRMPRIIATLAMIWQLALIGAYWPFASHADVDTVAAPIRWPVQSLIIAGILAMLALGFVAMFLIPGISLARRVGAAATLAWSEQADHADAIERVFAADQQLLQAWEDYRAQWLSPDEGDEMSGSRNSARHWFDLSDLAHARLRMEFFKNLPGVFTGLGIIGTFTGLILGLRTFRISQDPAVIQHSLESLLSGVWEAFMVSALAITLSILATIVEKLLMSSLARQVERLVLGLDRLRPPRSGTEASDWMPRLVEQFSASVASLPARAALAEGVASSEQPRRWDVAPEPASFASMTPPGIAGAAHEAQAVESSSSTRAWQEVANATQASAAAATELVQKLPQLMERQLQVATQAQNASMQAMKLLAGRLENVASGIEVSGRKTLEGVAMRVMQSEMNMVARHNAVIEQLCEVVQRIEVLCGLLQQDHLDGDRSMLGQVSQQRGWPAPPQPQDPYQRQGGGPASHFSLGNGFPAPGGFANANDGGFAYPPDDDPWARRPEGGFGS